MTTKFIFFLVLTTMAVLIVKQTRCDLNYFTPLVDECNRTFTVSREAVFSNDVKKISELLKTNKNGMCFVHCIFTKLELADSGGSINKADLFLKLNALFLHIPKKQRSNFALSPKLKDRLISLIELCESSEAVAEETDPCEKLFNVFLCFDKIN